MMDESFVDQTIVKVSEWHSYLPFLPLIDRLLIYLSSVTNTLNWQKMELYSFFFLLFIE